MVNAINVVERVRVADGGRQIAAQVGIHLVGRVAELLEMPLELSSAMAPTVERRSRHDRGRLLTQVASDATVWRTFDTVDEATLARLRDARAAATGRLLERFDHRGGLQGVRLTSNVG